MLGSSTTGREYNQEQILLNSVSSIGIPLSLTTTTSTINTTGTSSLLQRPVTSLPHYTSNIVSTSTSSSNSFSTIEDTNDINKKETDVATSNTTATSTNSLKTGIVNAVTSIDSHKSDLTDITSDLKISTEDILFKFQEDNNNTSNTSSSSTTATIQDVGSHSSTTIDDKTKYEGLPTSLFLSSSLPLNLDDPESTNNFLNGAIDMNIDLLNGSFAHNLSDLNIDMSTDSTLVTTNTTPSSSSAVTSSTTTAISNENGSATNANATGETGNIKTELILKESNVNALNSIATTGTTVNAITGREDKKDILDFLSTEDLENNLKIFSFTDQSLLLSSHQKDIHLNADVQGLTSGLPLLNDPTITNPSSLTVLTDSINSTTTNTTTTTATTTASITTKTSIISNSSTDATVALNHSTALTMNTTVTNTTNIKVDPTIPPQVAGHSNSRDLIGAQNTILALPSNMMNDSSAYYNIATAGHPAGALPSNPTMTGVPKVNYYPQNAPPVGAPPAAMVKAPTVATTGPQNEIMMKKNYNVKQDSTNEIQKNRDANAKNSINNGKMNDSNSNVKVNMKSVKSGAPKGRRVQSRNASLRPTLSYVELITEAICDSEDGLLSLQEIYDAIKRKYVYFRTADPAWQNSIRHNLSVHQSFTKITRPPNRPGKGFLWTSSKIDYQNLSSENRKRRKRDLTVEKAHNNNNAASQPPKKTYRPSYQNSTAATINSSNVPPQQAITNNNNMNDINYLLNQQQQQPRVSQKVLKLLSDNTINTPSLKQLLFTGFKHMSNEPYQVHGNGLNYPMNSFDSYHAQAHSSMYGTSGSQYLTNSSGFSSQMAGNSSMPLSFNSLIMTNANGPSSTISNTNTAFAKGSAAASFQSSFGNSSSSLPLANIENISAQKYGGGSSLYPISLLDPEYSFRYPSQSMYRSSYYYPNPKNDVLMHNNTRRYSFDSAMTSSAAFAAAHNNPNNSTAPSPPFFSQNTKNIPSGPNYIKKDREKKIMYEKIHLNASTAGSNFNNMVNSAQTQYTNNSATNYIGTGTATAPLSYTHKHLPANYGNNIGLQTTTTFNGSTSLTNLPSSKSLTTPVIYETKAEHSPLESTALQITAGGASTVVKSEAAPIIVANKEQA
ncbi:hypothetical protein BCR36DRAFT_35533 [Piromyces finnis]|uniref:Fork-head domain-containing protein n=1 Tax=Piromyces finnis TaxID=1754191 RepID=A0A1Y1VBR3_9FUNG|nr:hypothetical protein BCR36DRAFT_35533 [Piromyces finnis]|eukprot:ORX52197.1 hypothetical protein BCR36DRAFT_35533 [Piromyces finnis]